MSRDIHMPLAIDDIDVLEGRREVVAATVKRLADSIEQIGMRHPITVRRKGDRYSLVAGRHRLEACKKLGREHVPAVIVSMTNAEARKWEIAENLHRAELTKLERDEQIAEWIRITEAEVSLQFATKPQGGRPESGVNAAARELGIEQTDAFRASKVGNLTDEAKDAIREVGLDKNRSAYLEVARVPQERQVATVHEIANRKSTVDGDVRERAAYAVAEMLAEYVPGSAWDNLKANLYAAGAANVANALTNVTGEAVMDRRFGA